MIAGRSEFFDPSWFLWRQLLLLLKYCRSVTPISKCSPSAFKRSDFCSFQYSSAFSGSSKFSYAALEYYISSLNLWKMLWNLPELLLLCLVQIHAVPSASKASTDTATNGSSIPMMVRSISFSFANATSIIKFHSTDRYALCDLSDSGIARCNSKFYLHDCFCHTCCDGMLSSATSYDQYFHVSSPLQLLSVNHFYFAICNQINGLRHNDPFCFFHDTLL